MGMELVLSLRDRRTGDRNTAGDKAAGLHLLLRHGFPVPPGFCVLPCPARIGSAETLRGLPPDFHRAVGDTYRRLGGLVAVRSSVERAAPCPAILGLNGTESTVRAVARCMTSGASDRNHPASYRPVVVQRLVDAVASGTAYSRDPKTGEDAEIVITGRWGIDQKEGADGAKDDLFRLRKYPLYLLQREISHKAQEVRAGPVGLVHRPLPQALRRAPCLKDGDLLRLGLLVRQVEERVGYPVEVAWALTERGFLLLQLGPASVPPEDAFYLTPEAGGGEGEALRRLSAGGLSSGVLSPLAWDVISRGSRAVLEPFLNRGGQRALARLVPLTLVAGRAYCNVTASSLALAEALHLPEGVLRRFAEGPRGAVPMALLLRLVRRPFFILRLWRHLAPGNAAPLCEEMVEETERLSRFLQERHEVQALAAALAAADTLLLRSFDIYLRFLPVSFHLARVLERLRRWCGPGGIPAGYRLLGQAGLDGPGVGHALWEIAHQAREGGDPPSWERFQRTFGHWSVGALDPANPRWGDDPGLLIQQWRPFLEAAAARSPDDYAAERAAESEEAAAWLDDRLARGWGRVLFWRRRAPRRWRAQFVARWAILADAKSALLKLVRVYRRLLLRAGEELCARGLLADPEQIFLLRPAEIQTALLARPDPDALRSALKRRATARNLYRTIDPPVLITGLYRLTDLTPPCPGGDVDLLRGEGASPGVHRGVARIVDQPAALARVNPGDVVVAVAFDTGYAPLFLAAGAVVTEIGGRLADVAVLAREFGRPAVVGAARAGSAIVEGDLIEVDGDRGLIRIIARRAAIDPPASTTA